MVKKISLIASLTLTVLASSLNTMGPQNRWERAKAWGREKLSAGRQAFTSFYSPRWQSRLSPQVSSTTNLTDLPVETRYPRLSEYPRYPQKEEYEQLRALTEKARPETEIAMLREKYGADAPVGLAVSILPEQQNVYPFRSFTKEDYKKGRVVHPAYMYEHRPPTEADVEAMKLQDPHYFGTYTKLLHGFQQWPSQEWPSQEQWQTALLREKAARIRGEMLEDYRKKVSQWLNQLSQEERAHLQAISDINKEKGQLMDAMQKRRLFETSPKSYKK